jgi:solute carrier family 12 sodium/potassium/chloride transporter 2
MYTVGFAESMVSLLKSFDTYVVEGDEMNSTRVIGLVAIVFQVCIVCIGMSWEAKAQIGLLVILLAAIVDFVVGRYVFATKIFRHKEKYNYAH